MFDIGWPEILIILGIAVIVVGPKDLPKIVRTIGKWRGKASAYARDFQRSIEEAADVTEMDAIKKEIAEANRELNEAKRDLDEKAATVKSDMDQATKDTTLVKVNSDGAVSEPGAGAANTAAAQKGNGEAAPEGSAGDQSGEASADTARQKPGAGQENGANA
ncbi:MAG: Sec-independent protein translocase protein TatB [Alphaproteobacteria bacterium]|jgi:sec-independent protein translocase protein TatB|nr:Sec-independent protein translocase protein TatB [Alphaproteobacteria bacterium]|tara:strand:- start:1166 stop:1651 length:486 start_codon:yes stop_codon:yes gene_type:complete